MSIMKYSILQPTGSKLCKLLICTTLNNIQILLYPAALLPRVKATSLQRNAFFGFFSSRREREKSYPMQLVSNYSCTICHSLQAPSLHFLDFPLSHLLLTSQQLNLHAGSLLNNHNHLFAISRSCLLIFQQLSYLLPQFSTVSFTARQLLSSPSNLLVHFSAATLAHCLLLSSYFCSLLTSQQLL
jgi:hypothetical protein